MNDLSQPTLIARLLEVIEKSIVPLTQRGVEKGNKVFGAAILRKSDLSLVVAGTNTETENPLWHGEVYTLKRYYELPRNQRPPTRECVFLSTHEPCSLCLSAITWTGFDNFYYLFGYADTKDTFNIPHDLKILEEVFRVQHGNYARENQYWKSHDIVEMINKLSASEQENLLSRVRGLEKVYDDMSKIYQASKQGGDADIPLA